MLEESGGTMGKCRQPDCLSSDTTPLWFLLAIIGAGDSSTCPVNMRRPGEIYIDAPILLRASALP